MQQKFESRVMFLIDRIGKVIEVISY